MKPLTKLGYLAAACALLVTTFAMIGPRAVRAAVATLVEVSNTTANPIPNKNVDEPARHAWTALCEVGSAGTSASCTITTPNNEEVVVQAETYSVGADRANTYMLFSSSATTAGSPFVVYAQAVDNDLSQPDNSYFANTASATMYLDPNSALVCTARTKGLNVNRELNGTCLYSGYYVTLP